MRALRWLVVAGVMGLRLWLMSQIVQILHDEAIKIAV
jgi:hypothetical protein